MVTIIWGGGLLLAPNGKKAGMLLHVLQCIRQAWQHRGVEPNIPQVLVCRRSASQALGPSRSSVSPHSLSTNTNIFIVHCFY